MFENNKEIKSESRMGRFVRTQEAIFGVALLGVLYYLRLLVHASLHIYYFIFAFLFTLYMIAPVPRTKGKKIYNIYVTWLYRGLRKVRDEKWKC